MSWIRMISYEEADKNLERIYNKVKGPNNTIDNVLRIHSLRPHTLVGHMSLYKNVLHNSNNTLPKWYLEAIGVYVSFLNDCEYCVAHHFSGFKRLIDDDTRANRFMEVVKHDSLNEFFDEKFYKGMLYAKDLTMTAHSIKKEHIDSLLSVGFSEGEILEVNQVASYFNYVNRTVIGLGVTTDGDILGLSPNDSDDPANWSHS